MQLEAEYRTKGGRGRECGGRAKERNRARQRQRQRERQRETEAENELVLRPEIGSVIETRIYQKKQTLSSPIVKVS
jgi:hypothetical protein